MVVMPRLHIVTVLSWVIRLPDAHYNLFILIYLQHALPKMALFGIFMFCALPPPSDQRKR